MTTGVLAIAAVLVRWLAMASGNSDDAIVQFEDEMPPAVISLGLLPDGLLPVESEQRSYNRSIPTE